MKPATPRPNLRLVRPKPPLDEWEAAMAEWPTMTRPLVWQVETERRLVGWHAKFWWAVLGICAMEGLVLSGLWWMW